MMSRSGGLNPRAVAGSPSVTRFTQSNWTGIRASGKPRIAVKKILQVKKTKTLLVRDTPGRERIALVQLETSVIQNQGSKYPLNMGAHLDLDFAIHPKAPNSNTSKL